MSAGSKITPPFGPPDCPWKSVSSDSSIPETVVYKDGQLDGDKVYIGRVYDDDCLYIGTAIPTKGVCRYLDKNSEVKSSADYEILTVDCGDPLVFKDIDLESRNIFKAGKDEKGGTSYVGCVTDGNNTYYGWVDTETKSVHIPGESSVGPQVLNENFTVLFHKFLDRLCICPPFIPPKTA